MIGLAPGLNFPGFQPLPKDPPRMPTINQLVRKGRHQIVVKDGSAELSMVDTRPDGVWIGTYLAGPVLLANGAVAPPRLTLAQANALPNKVDGMVVQISNTARGERPCWWNGSGPSRPCWATRTSPTGRRSSSA